MPELPRTVSGDASSDELKAMRKAARHANCVANDAAYNRARGSAAARGYGYRWRRLRRMVLNREPLCVRCGVPATDVDHIVPRSRGGGDDFENLQAMCRSCHSRKTSQEDGGFGR